MAKEAYSRVVIDRLLREVGWDIEDENQVVFEDHGSAGRADYILKDKTGHPLALIEAKSPDIDPYLAKRQALDYVEEQYKNNIKYIFLANDHLIYFWNLIDGGDATAVSDFLSQDDLIRKNYQLTSHTAEPLLHKKVELDYFKDIDPNFKLRPYHLEAWEAIAKDYDKGKRSFLLEMATGTGKTVLTGLIASKFIRTNQAQTILFVVDRVELAGQTKGVFEKLLGNLSIIATYWGGSKKNILGANIVVATIQSLVLHGRDVFSPGYFDVIIHDEAHRSIYSPEARAAMDYFIGATKIGLTATPKDFLKNFNFQDDSLDPRAIEARIQRDTYKYFDCEQGQATYRYTIQDGVRDGFLVQPKLHKMTSFITQQALSDKGFQVEGDYENESYKINDLEKKIFLPERNKLMMQEFLAYAEKNPSGEIGKTIIFAVSQKHAEKLAKILNELKPEFKGRFADIITSKVSKAHEIARDFKKPETKFPRVAVSVDMLTTGYDAPEVQNIVLARPVFEPTLYQQIKGRGTRVCPEINKKSFTIFDFCGVCEYFEEKYDWEAPLELPKEQSLQATQLVSYGNGQSYGIDQLNNPALRQAIDFSPTFMTEDLVADRDVVQFGPDGDVVDRQMYQDDWTTEAKKFAEQNPKVAELIQDDKTQELIDLLNEELLNRPEKYFNGDTLSKTYRVNASPVDFFLAALNKKELPTHEEQLTEWRQGFLDKYGKEQGKPSQKLTLMVQLLVDQVIKDSSLRESILEKLNISFLQQEPFTVYSVDEWINTFGKDKLLSMVADIYNSKILQL